jgi:Flp pilus assembly protein TadD
MLHVQRSAPTLDDGGHSEAETLKDLGVSTVERRRFEGAVIALQTAARLFGEVNDRHSEGRTLHNLAVCLTQAGRAGEAVTVHEEAAKIFRLTGDRQGESATVTGQKMARDAQGSS